jgi:hypothetical protein
MVVGGTLCVRINNVLEKYFATRKGVRQGDPISPQLFNIIGFGLARTFRKAHELSNLCLVAHLIPFGVVILQYVDDTIIMFKENVEMAINVNILLYLYDSMSRLKINFDKSEFG